MNTKHLIAGAAVAGLLSGAYASQTQQGKSAAPGTAIVKMAEKGQHACKGQNECKGQGGCKTGDNGCKGKNSCKGKGGCATKKG